METQDTLYLLKDIIYRIVSLVEDFPTLRAIRATCKGLCERVDLAASLMPVCFFQQEMSSTRNRQLHFNTKENRLYAYDEFKSFSFAIPPHFKEPCVEPLSFGRHPMSHFKYCIGSYGIVSSWLNTCKNKKWEENITYGIGYYQKRDVFYYLQRSDAKSFYEINELYSNGECLTLHKFGIGDISYFSDDVVCLLVEEEDAIYVSQVNRHCQRIDKICIITGRVRSSIDLPFTYSKDDSSHATHILDSMAYHKGEARLYFTLRNCRKIFAWDSNKNKKRSLSEIEGILEKDNDSSSDDETSRSIVEKCKNSTVVCVMKLSKKWLSTCSVKQIVRMAIDDERNVLYISDYKHRLFYVPIDERRK